MTQQLALFDPSIEYYCHSCRKPLKHSVRIIAKITDFDCFLDFCPPCLAHQNYLDKVQEYFISKKVGAIFQEMSNVDASQLLQAISTVQKQGIQQMFLKGLKSSDRQFKIYQQLNSQIFNQFSVSKRERLSVQLGQCKIPIGGIEKEKPNPANRKHLKTLGYNWQREQFNFQPQVIFGYLMGCLQEQAEPTQDQIQLRSIIYNYYSKQVETINEVKQFLIQSPFLLARKAITDIQQVPKQILQLKNIEAEIKEMIISICNMTIDEEQPQQNNDSSLSKHGERVKHHKQKKNKKQREHSESSVPSNKDQRERTRQKKQKKKNKEQSKNQPSKPLQSSLVKQEKTQLADSGSEHEVGQVKRKRGRPKGSKSTVKVQRRRGKSRVFELKMDIDTKISHKRERTDIQDLLQCEESGENRKKRKLNEETESQQDQQQQEDSRNRESSDEE